MALKRIPDWEFAQNVTCLIYNICITGQQGFLYVDELERQLKIKLRLEYAQYELNEVLDFLLDKKVFAIREENKKRVIEVDLTLYGRFVEYIKFPKTNFKDLKL